ncbi:MAG TPA: FAD-dependent monooxygenase [Anaerolineae bacterium]|nr:FAD-dependent monooxygenase [Anaerolineae bacterium]
MEKRKVLIVGGGIAGLCLALGLRRGGHEVVVVEQAEAWAPVGTGIMLHGNGMAVLGALGVGEGVAARGKRMVGMRVTNRGGKELGYMDLEVWAKRVAPSYAIHRAHLHEVLVAGCAGVDLRLGQSIADWEENDEGVWVWLTTGEEERYDVVVGADGIRSRVRAMWWEKRGKGEGVAKPELVYSGYTCWRFVAENRTDLEMPVEMWGRGARLGWVPLPDDLLYVYRTLNAERGGEEAEVGRVERVKGLFADFGDRAPLALDGLSEETVLLRHDLEELGRTVVGSGRVILVGDAAQALTPNLGQGAAQAIEGAWRLAGALGESGSVGEARAVYWRGQGPRVAMVRQRSRMVGRMGQLESGILCGVRDWVSWLTPRGVMARQLGALIVDPTK